MSLRASDAHHSRNKNVQSSPKHVEEFCGKDQETPQKARWLPQIPFFVRPKPPPLSKTSEDLFKCIASGGCAAPCAVFFLKLLQGTRVGRAGFRLDG